MRLVLASASPRRRELLAALGLPFEVIPSDVVETLSVGVPPEVVTVRLALAKARGVAARLAAHGPAGSALILGADTLVVLDGRPLGKPESLAEARAMLEALAGRAHEVVTGVALVEVPGGRAVTEAVVSRVVMQAYSIAEVEAYAATPEPYDKAGGYAVQGAGGRLVARVEGCYTNVVGLPVTTTARLLRGFGVPVKVPAESGPAEPGPR